MLMTRHNPGVGISKQSKTSIREVRELPGKANKYPVIATGNKSLGHADQLS